MKEFLVGLPIVAAGGAVVLWACYFGEKVPAIGILLNLLNGIVSLAMLAISAMIVGVLVRGKLGYYDDEKPNDGSERKK